MQAILQETQAKTENLLKASADAGYLWSLDLVNFT